ncbi:OmpA/MotB domain protein [Emticicia oligotrophica DSM 17448]|uniref:OmpA/MotB domain protein n=1 Tax=Emticicia oligotrophica (strain DSM 17448 / CIP 109782 / MTCC 6937 / GPTSA100-15) TaxID=929562 RepID=A0ABM5MYT3_EMTOG|nr:OmpA family protein [Emticicia oligotrophica]AFK02332.1 OmpA/MotB domain protein [Emticicia oligotrophica DSM 17448]
MKRILHIIALLVFANSVFGQIQLYKRGLSSFDKGQYDLAIKDLTKVVNIDESEKANLYHKIAESYRLSNRWVEAVPFYQKAFEAKLTNPEAHFHYAFALKAAGNYDLALKELQQFIDSKSTIKAYNEKAYREVNTLKTIDDIKKKQSVVEFKNLSQLNTKGSEFAPMVLGDELIFTASRKNKIYSNGLPYVGLYKVKIDKSIAEMGKIEKFSDAIFDEERNEGTPTFSPDGKTMIYSRGNTGKRKDLSPDMDLYISRYVDGSGWTEPRYVSASDSASWDGTPAFSRDGKTIYFSSNRPGGFGGLDIYRVNMDASGRFGNPVNLGKEINTAGDEMFPYVSEDGKLYFASDGHPGLGKLDLFLAVRAGGKITVENMGIPYNSNMDDFGLVMSKRGDVFFSSNRAGGSGDDDIYFYEAPKKTELAENDDPSKNPLLAPKKGNPDSTAKALEIKTVNYYLVGTITTKNNNTFVPLDSARVRVVDTENDEVIIETSTGNDGKFGPVKLKVDGNYLVMSKKQNYLTNREEFSMSGREIPQSLLKKAVTDTTFYTSLNLEKVFVGVTFRLDNIYYDLDKWDIRPDAAIELDKLVQVLVDNPQIKIELGSHTDSRATEIYNLRLSQKRAESAINYIVSKGISRERLTAKGYGESELIIKNAKTEEEHQTNRRTEFKVLEIE